MGADAASLLVNLVSCEGESGHLQSFAVNFQPQPLCLECDRIQSKQVSCKEYSPHLWVRFYLYKDPSILPLKLSVEEILSAIEVIL
jgi:hypothetical protein